MSYELLAVPVTILLQTAGPCVIETPAGQSDEGLCAGPSHAANRGGHCCRAPSRRPEQFAALIRSEIPKYAKILKDSGAK
jgi:hypothetical protein